MNKIKKHRRPHKTSDLPVQDVGTRFAEDNVPVYYVHGLRQWYGTCKLHARLDCPHLVHWTPGIRMGHRMGKTLMRDWHPGLDSVPERQQCKTCWPRPGGVASCP
jgi:hypothetical protein